MKLFLNRILYIFLWAVVGIPAFVIYWLAVFPVILAAKVPEAFMQKYFRPELFEGVLFFVFTFGIFFYILFIV